MYRLSTIANSSDFKDSYKVTNTRGSYSRSQLTLILDRFRLDSGASPLTPSLHHTGQGQDPGAMPRRSVATRGLELQRRCVL